MDLVKVCDHMQFTTQQETIKLLAEFLKGRSVLLIDPSQNYRTSLKQFLTNLKVKNICAASSTDEAKRFLLTHKVGFLIVEWIIQKDNGLEFCRELQKQKQFRDIPYLLITGENLKNDVILASEVNIDGYLLKPFSYEGFTNKILEITRGVLNPSPLAKNLQEAESCLDSGDLEQASAIFNEVYAKNPDSARALVGLASVAKAERQHDKAITFLNRACGINPDYMPGYRLLLEIYESQDDREHVLAIAQRLHELSPDNPKYALKLATLYLLQQDMENSEQLFRRTIQLSPRIAAAYKGLGDIALRKNDSAAAEKHYRKALDIEQTDISTLNSLGLAYIRMGKFKEGIQKYLMAFRLEPEDPRILFNLGNAYEKQGRLEKALYYYEKAIIIDETYQKAQVAIDRINAGLRRD